MNSYKPCPFFRNFRPGACRALPGTRTYISSFDASEFGGFLKFWGTPKNHHPFLNGGFLEWGCPKIIHFSGFSLINQPFWGSIYGNLQMGFPLKTIQLLGTPISENPREVRQGPTPLALRLCPRCGRRAGQRRWSRGGGP